MSGNGSMTQLYIFILVLNLVFPVLGYTFTTFGETQQRYETSLDPDSLMTIGVNLVDAESHILTFRGPYVYYALINVTIRGSWTTLMSSHGLIFEKQSAVSLAFDNWWFPYKVGVKSVASNEWFVILRNETILRDFDTEYNWSRFVLEDGHHVFITPFANDGNMSKAIYVDGTLNVTLAKSFDTETNFNFWTFIGWYSSMMIGDQSWGLPSVFAWVLRILGALSLFATIMLTKELIKL